MKILRQILNFGVVLILGFASSRPMWSQASEIPSAGQVIPNGETPEQHGRKLLNEMLEALGGDA